MSFSPDEFKFILASLEKLLQKQPYSTSVGRKLLLELIVNPNKTLTPAATSSFGFFQTYLRDVNSKFRYPTLVAICLSTLPQDKEFIADKFRGDIVNQKDCLDLQGSYLDKLDPDCFQAVRLLILSSPQFRLIKLGYNNLNTAPLSRFQDVCDLVRTSPHISSLSLEKNDLGKMNEDSDKERYQAFYLMIQSSPHLRSLSLGQNYLELWNLGQWQRFAKLIQSAASLNSLDLSFTHFHALNAESFEVVVTMLKSSMHLHSLDLLGCSMSDWNNDQLALFCKSIQSSPHLMSLNLSRNGLDLFTEQSFKMLFLAIKSSSHLRSLSFSFGELASCSTNKIRIVCDALRSLTFLSSLDISVFGIMNIESFRDLFDMIKLSSLTELDITSLNLDEEKKQYLLSVLEDNFSLRIMKSNIQDDKFIDMTNDFLARNSKISEALELCKKILANKHIKLNSPEGQALLNDANIAIAKTTQVLQALQGKDSTNSNKTRQELERLLYEVEWTRANWFGDNNMVDEAVQAWLAITPKSSYYQQAHFEAFHLSYMERYRIADENPYLAFIMALPCCINEESQLIFFNDDYQRTFDGFLARATSGGDDLQKRIYAPKERAARLHLLIMQRIHQIISRALRPTNINPYFFTVKERYLGLLDLLKNLPVITKGVAEETLQKQIEELWDNVVKRLKSMPLEDNELMSLIVALSPIAKQEREPPAPKP